MCHTVSVPSSSPRTWGWTASSTDDGRERRVVPTHVGVDRCLSRRPRRETSRPHARGGGPVWVSVSNPSSPSSPRTWGWTGALPDDRRRDPVVPTHVGVDRPQRNSPSCSRRRPHALGGGPEPVPRHLVAAWSSPRTWGWTGLHDRLRGPDAVVPTHVGVDRRARGVRPAAARRPHARGGGPWVSAAAGTRRRCRALIRVSPGLRRPRRHRVPRPAAARR